MENEKAGPSGILDVKWYSRFSELASFQAYEYVRIESKDRDEQKKLFFEGKVENPTFDYNKLDSGTLDTKIDSLFELKRDIIKNEHNEVVKQTYRWRINEKIAEVFMLKAAESGDMRRFKRWSEFVFGKPSEEVFAYTISNVKSEINRGLLSDNPQVKEAAESLNLLLKDAIASSSAFGLPDEKDVTSARQITLKEFKNVISINNPDEKKIFNAEEVKDYFEKALGALSLRGWSAVIDKNIAAISVGQENKSVEIPESRTLTFEEINSLVLHEIGTHVLRRENGERSKLMLLGLGLDRYLRAEEGIATMREQMLGEKIEDFSGFDGHLAIGLAYGFAGKALDFRGVYNILEKYYLLDNLNSGKENDVVIEKARDRAWNRCVRTFRGTDCKTPGTCFTQDIVYREGNIDMWRVVRENPDEMLRFSVGKYDPSNSRHLWILEQLGISDADLRNE